MQLQEHLETFQSLNAELWVISPDEPDKLESMRSERGLTFPTLVDSDLALTRAYGLLNEGSGKVPHPAALVLDREGKITYLRVDESVVVRPEPTELIEALRALPPADS